MRFLLAAGLGPAAGHVPAQNLRERIAIFSGIPGKSKGEGQRSNYVKISSQWTVALFLCHTFQYA